MHFCNRPLWDHQKVWNTTDPDLTDCFQDTVLVAIPFGFLWLLLPVVLHRYGKKAFLLTNKWTLPAVVKTAIVAALVVISLCDFFYLIHHATKNDHEAYVGAVSVSLLLAQLIKAISFGLSIAIIYMDRRKGISSSGYQFSFWLLLVICGAVEFRTELKQALDGGIPNIFMFVTEMIYYPLVVLVFALFCFVDEDANAKEFRKSHWPEYRSSFPSRLVFSWFSGLVYKGWRRPLIQTDMWELDPKDKTSTVTHKFDENWKQELDRGRNNHLYQPSLVKAVGKTYWKLMVVTGILQLLATVLLQTVALPFALRYIIKFVSDPHAQHWKGYFVAVALFLISVGFSIFLAQFYHFGSLISLRMRSALIGLIYRKSLRITAHAKREKSSAEIVNLMAVDAQRFTLSPIHVHSLWGCLLQIVISVYLLYQIIGPSVFAGIGAMLLTIPMVGVVMRKNRVVETVQLTEKDKRMKIMNEILNGIKILKLYAWEESFEDKVQTVRNRELDALRKSAHLKAINMITWLFTPSLIALISFTTFVLSSDANILNPTNTFVSLALFGILRLPLALLPAAITGIIQSKISLNRISAFLQSDEIDGNNVTRLPRDDKSCPFALSMRTASFKWDKDEEPVLRDIDMCILPGKLVAVVGPVGSGKSSLCGAFLGLLEKTAGEVIVKGTVAYCSQSAWIQNMSVKDNILFGLPYNEEKYEEVVEATALQPDFDILPAGDETEIGERGINLSGGQKQRISIARAVYSQSDIYILDDPLSAVDAHVGRHIFERVIGPKGLLSAKTRLLITHGASFLPAADSVVFVRAGEVSAFAELPKLMRIGEFSEFHENLKVSSVDDEPVQFSRETAVPTDVDEDEPLSAGVKLRNGNPAAAVDDIELKDLALTKKSLLRKSSSESTVQGGENAKLIGAEKAQSGKVSWKIYATLLRYASFWATFVTVAAHAIYTAFVLAANIWLSFWSEDNMRKPDGHVDTELRDYRLGIYALFSLLQAVFIYISALVLALSCIKASRRFHSEMLQRMLRAPLVFFETTPVGRILNRFSRDLDTLDTQLPTHFKMWINGLFILLSVLVLICISTPLFAAVVPVVSLLYLLIQKAFVPSSRQIKRLESISRSPVLSHFQESLSGRPVILAMNQEERFVQLNDKLNDIHNTSSYANAVGQRWILIRVEALGSVCTFFAALFAVIGKGQWEAHPGLLGLAITYATTMTSSFNWLVRTSSDIEANVVSVERMQEYTEIQQEAAWHVPSKRPLETWPEKGEIQFQDYGLRYRDNLDLVLKSINCSIFGGERIGVCGRTGAGKSSLISALFRIVEAAAGKIKIDHIDISELGLHDVRCRITIIPQDPVLFSGSLRENLDPFNAESDTDIWRVLELSHLKPFVQNHDAGLLMEIAESGDNLSMGQRQLVCLARALLRKSRILVLDEATASVDLECDELIQMTIRKEFKGCTVITVAHRLSTIMDYDRVMVLEQGEVSEFATPKELLANPSSLFHSLAKTANLVV